MRIEQISDGTYRKVLDSLEIMLLERIKEPPTDVTQTIEDLWAYMRHQMQLINDELNRINGVLQARQGQ